MTTCDQHPVTVCDVLRHSRLRYDELHRLYEAELRQQLCALHASGNLAAGEGCGRLERARAMAKLAALGERVSA